MGTVDFMYIYTQNRILSAKDRMKEFWTSQDGVSNVVATIIILLIVVLLIAAFWSQLKTWIQGIMNQIFGSSFDDSGLSGSGDGGGL